MRCCLYLSRVFPAPLSHLLAQSACPVPQSKACPLMSRYASAHVLTSMSTACIPNSQQGPFCNTKEASLRPLAATVVALLLCTLCSCCK